MSAHDPDVTVQLRAARIPVVGTFAHHHWLVIERGATRDRWEVWQHADVGGESWGHLHRNLLDCDRGVGNGPSWLIRRWSAAAAAALAERVEGSPERYPWCTRYRLWPGPNSNTYVQWVLAGAFRLGWKGWGRSYGGVVVGSAGTS